MRASLLILIVMACLLSAGEADPTIQRIVETARGLIRAQREDGSWLEPRARDFFVTSIPPPPAMGEQVRTIAPENRYRSSVAGFSFATEALWRVRTWVPAASAAAAHAHLLAAKALIADPHQPVTLEEAFPFLLAHAVRADQEGDPTLTAAVQACRESFAYHLRRGSLGDIFFGLVDPANPQRIDLLLTCLAVDLLPQQRRTWMADPSTRIARFQPLLPPVHTEGGAPPPATEFEDGTAFAVGCMQQPDDAAMELLRSAYGSKELKDMELTRALVCMRVFARRAQDPPEAWWRSVAERWTADLVTQTRRHEDEQGVWLEWLDRRIPVDVSSGFALHWLVACQQIRTNDERRAAQEGLARARDRWMEERIASVLVRLKNEQRPDGSWGEGAEAAELTPLALLGFLGVGYDHVVPHAYRRTVKNGVRHLLGTRGGSVSTRVLALRTMALCEAYAMTNDPELLAPCQQGVAALLALRLPDGGFGQAADPGRRHWPTTTLAVMALKSAHAGGLTVPIDELKAWWPGAIGEPTTDSLEDLACKATAGVFLGWRPAPDAPLMHELLGRTATDLPADPWMHYVCSLPIFQAGGAAWNSWQMRSAVRPAPGSSAPLAHVLVAFLADALIMRYMQVQALTP